MTDIARPGQVRILGLGAVLLRIQVCRVHQLDGPNAIGENDVFAPVDYAKGAAAEFG